MDNTHSTEKPVLLILEGEQAGQHWQVDGEMFVIGRGDTCDLVLNERQVSREHIRVYCQRDQYYVEDLNSKNGTWLNEDKLMAASATLQDGDVISIGLVVQIRFVASEITAPLNEQDQAFQNGVLSIDRGARRVYIRGQEVYPPLSLPQYRLLEFLYNRHGNVCTREEIVRTVWVDDDIAGISDQAIDALIRRLRERLNQIEPDIQFVRTMRNHGFVLHNPPDA